MSEQFEMQLAGNSHWQADKKVIVQSSTHVTVSVGAVYMFIQSNVDLFRTVELINGLKRVVDYTRDHNLMVGTGPLYVYNAVGASVTEMRTAAVISGVNLNDIGIGIGANLRVDPGGDESLTQILDSAFRMLREHINDEFLKKL